jgi:hypothetical protein
MDISKINNIMSFFKSLLSAEGEVSSKRLAGLSLVTFFIAAGIVAVVQNSMSEVVESIIKTSLYTGVGLLGVNAVSDTITKTVKRQPVVVKEEDDEQKPS